MEESALWLYTLRPKTYRISLSTLRSARARPGELLSPAPGGGGGEAAAASAAAATVAGERRWEVAGPLCFGGDKVTTRLGEEGGGFLSR